MFEFQDLEFQIVVTAGDNKEFLKGLVRNMNYFFMQLFKTNADYADEDYADFVKHHILYTAENAYNEAPISDGISDGSDDGTDFVEFLSEEAPKDQARVAHNDVEAAINEPNVAPHVDSLMTVQLRPHNLRTRCLTIPKKFVRMHQMQKYLWAKVHFQTGWYPEKVFIRWDSRRPGDDTHVVLQVNWKKVVEDTGMIVNDNFKCEFTLQFNIEKCEGDVADFDIIW
uniref:uncharacterized protein LOC122602430 n=1 Tax=Erigeron canadensis TaxID=72917 RepID=UPI001CB92CEC|nr:uncharacterized protein LOC122602430 [Erigeron canadensis]